jgi:hypothetical protein
MVLRSRVRGLPALVLLLLLVLLPTGACSNSDDEAKNPTGRTTTTASRGASTTSSSDRSATTTTAVGGGPTSTAVPSGGEGQGVIELVIVGGNPEGGVRRETVKQGAQVTLRVTSDVADELHVHTYDLKLDLVAGQSADLTFLAKVPGVFEVELEDRGKKVLELEVRP